MLKHTKTSVQTTCNQASQPAGQPTNNEWTGCYGSLVRRTFLTKKNIKKLNLTRFSQKEEIKTKKGFPKPNETQKQQNKNSINLMDG